VAKLLQSRAMQEHEEQWKQLCVQAATEQDPKKLIELVKEINRLLEQKQHRLESKPPKEK
jgi:hypothetical protein